MSDGHLAPHRVAFEKVTHERLDGETIAINLETGRYYSMSGPAADVFSGLSSGLPFSDWWGMVEEKYPQTARVEDVRDFFVDVEQAGLLAPIEGHVLSTEEVLPDDFNRGAWTKPVLQEFEDLQDLILVDPIHDTSNLGWPHVKDDSD